MRIASGTVGDNTVHVEVGDLAQVEVDAVVVPQFATGVSTGGVGGAMLRSGAEAGMWAYKGIVDENGSLPFGTAVSTASGSASSKALIHVVSVGSGQENEFGTVALAFRAALRKAAGLGMRTLAAPALGTGIIGYLSARQSAEAMLAALEIHAQEGNPPIEVRLVTYGSPEMAQVFRDVLSSRSYLKVDMDQPGLRDFDLERLLLAKVAIADDERMNEEAFGSPNPM